MDLLIFFFILIVSFIIVRIGAVVFELTGLEWSLAKFQSLSCFTGTGFTTREAELITGHPQRRSIASVLMVLGHAGLVTLIATLANSLRSELFLTRLPISSLHSIVPSYLVPAVNLLGIIIIVYAIYKFTNSKFASKLTDFLRTRIVKREIIKPVSFEELLVSTGGYGVSSIEVCKDSPILDKTLVDSDLKKFDILVLAVERGGETISNPPADIRITLNDKLICFGKLEHIREKLYVVPK